MPPAEPSPGPDRATDRPPPLTVWPVVGVPEVQPGDDLAQLLAAGLAASGLALRDGDVLVVSSKVVSKALGLVRPGAGRPEVVEEQTVRRVARRRGAVADTTIVEGRAGPVMAAAGVDASNAAPGQVLVLPENPDGAARDLRARLTTLAHDVVFGLVVADTAGRPWRDGVTDFALGAAGLTVLEDLRGQVDSHGLTLEVTVRAVADELAAAADLVKGKLTGVPAALVGGAGGWVTADDGPGAVSALRGRDGSWWQDWFRYGHVEAVRAALHAGERDLAGTADLVPPPGLGPETVAVRANRALKLALAAGPGRVSGSVAESMAGVVVELEGGSGYAMGAAVARLHVALWSEHLVTTARGPDTEDLRARFAVRELVD
jgi:coenzyme F420-0:L-glutamate ligase/coenzyme F420-1:gamma-L-glutamate ligase